MEKIILPRFLFLPFLLLGAASVAAVPRNAPDSVRTVYADTIYFSRNNGDWIERSEYVRTGRFLRAAQHYPEAMILLTGRADTTGFPAFNLCLSQKRAAAVGRYLVRKGIAADRIRTEGLGEDATTEPDKARRVEMSVRFTPPHQKCEKSALSDEPNDSVSPTKFPIRSEAAPANGRAVEIAADPDKTETAAQNVSSHPTEPVAQDTSEYGPAESAPAPVPSVRSDADPSPSSGRYLALKTNLAAWAGTILNVAADVQVGKHFSLEIPVLWCPWYVGDRHAVKTFTVQPEARYWLARPGKGHFFGLHAHVGWFNVRWDRDRYQDAGRPLLGAGISYGYLLPLGERWAGEFTLGVGYANLRYDTFYNVPNGARIDTRTKNYWGVTRAGISVVYRFNTRK